MEGSATCICSASGFCERYKRHMTSRCHAICKGTANGVSDQERLAYLRKWSESVGIKKPIPQKPRAERVAAVRCRAGTELKKLLSWFGQRESTGCNCNNHAEEMDARGCDWCSGNIETIAGWLNEEAAKKKVLGFSLNSVPGFDIAAKALIERAIDTARKSAKAPVVSPFKYDGQPPRFISLEQLGSDVRSLSSMIPSNAKGIVGIARSGLTPATMLAQILHLPLKVLRQHLHEKDYSIEDAGSGWRLSGNIGGEGPWVLVDDTVMSGNSFRYSLPVVKQHLGDVVTAALYVNPHARFKPDISAVELGWPHLLEWNMFNSVMTPSMAFDMDGILCHECPPQDDDDGQRYIDFLENVRPLYPVRKVVIPLIVTARLEKYRKQTVTWLHAHGMAVGKLVMGPWKNNRQRTFEEIVRHKASHFATFMTQRRPVKPPMFVESCPAQAEAIAKRTGGIVICPAAKRCF